MQAHPWHDVPLEADLEDWFPVYVEINRGCRVKYELDKRTGLLRVDRVLYSAVYYPTCYGFIPRTYCDDGDPLDALVLCREDLVPGVLLRARAIGVMEMRDEKGQDDKIIAVHVDDPFLTDITDVSSLSKAQIAELLRFFQDYKKLEGKEVQVDHPQGREEAMKVVRAAVEWYRRDETRLRTQM